MSNIVLYENDDETHLLNNENNSKIIKVDLNIIELPLFSKNKKFKPNVGAVYVISRQKNIRVEVQPGAGLTIPQDFDERIYFALVQIAQDFKERFNFPEIPNIIYTTYYEIAVKSGINRKGNINERILESLTKLKATTFKLLNCFYNPKREDKPLHEDYFMSSFIHLIHIQKVENVLKENSDFLKYIDPNTKSVEIIKIELNPFFLDNLLHKKGHLRHRVEDLAKIDGAARRIYLYCEKYRWYHGKRDYGTDKKMKISARKLAAIIPYNFVGTNISGVIIKLRKAFNFLKEKELIAEFKEYKGETQADTSYEVCFDWSRPDNYFKTGREEYEIVDYDEFIASSTIEEVNEIDYTTKVLKNKSKKLSTNIIQINESIADIVAPILSRINDETKVLINDYLRTHGKFYIQGSIQYTLEKATKHINSYLVGALENNWAKEYIFKLEEQDKFDEIATQEEQKKITEEQKKQQEEEQEKNNILEIEKLFSKLSQKVKNDFENKSKKMHMELEKSKSALIAEKELQLHLFALSIQRYYSKQVLGKIKLLYIQ